MVLTLKRSILTEKVARRGYHLSSEYGVDPLEILFVREVMRPEVVVLPSEKPMREFQQALASEDTQGQRLLPVINGEGQLAGVLTRGDIHKRVKEKGEGVWQRPVGEFVRKEFIETFPNETLRAVVYVMAEKAITRMPVVERDTRKFLGLLALDDLLKARARHLEEERRRQQVLNLLSFLPGAKAEERDERPGATETLENETRIST